MRRIRVGIDVGGTFTIDTNGAYFSGEVLGITTELIALP